MPHISRSALVSFSAAQMYELVNDVENYPEFLPWCGTAQVLSCSSTEMLARLELVSAGLRYGFTTNNRLDPPRQISLRLVDGVFTSLQGEWRFTQLGEDGSRIELEMDFSLPPAVMKLGIGRLFGNAADRMVEAFCQRAEHCYAQP